MATITEDYCDFETAKLLKDNGFPQQRMEFVVTTRDCSFIVNGSQKVKECAGTKFPYHPYSKLFLYEEDWAVLPTLQMAMKWLREKKNIFIAVYYDEDVKGYMYSIIKLVKGTVLNVSDLVSNSYEEAAEAAIKYCLENLI